MAPTVAYFGIVLIFVNIPGADLVYSVLGLAYGASTVFWLLTTIA